MGRHLSPQYGHVIPVSSYPVLTALSLQKYGCAISGCRLPHQLERVIFHIDCPEVQTDGCTVT